MEYNEDRLTQGMGWIKDLDLRAILGISETREANSGQSQRAATVGDCGEDALQQQ